MKTLSVCWIMRNEADVCARSLESAASFADELIVVDTGSDDNTVRIAEEHGAVVSQFLWIDDFSAARNFAFLQAHSDYLMWLDADDIVSAESAAIIAAAKQSDFGGADTLILPYQLSFTEDGVPDFITHRERILRRCAAAVWHGVVHEVITPFGVIASLDAPIEHRKLRPTEPGRNLRIYENRIASGKELSIREQFYYARELSDNAQFDAAEPIFAALLEKIPASSPDRGAIYRGLAQCRAVCGDNTGALRWLLAASEHGCPSAVTCYAIGEQFFLRGLYESAMEWYEKALGSTCATETFDQALCHTLYPCLQLCVCADRLGDHHTAKRWNDRALAFSPSNPAAQQNAAYFAART